MLIVIGSTMQGQSQSTTQVEIREVEVRLSDHGPVVLLKVENRVIPIFVDSTVAGSIQAALTGHLVLSTLHTNDAPTAITRLSDLGVPSYLMTSTVLGVMAQRLVRVLCPACKEKQVLEDSAWELLVSPWKAQKPDTTYVAKGCLDCRMTGYVGRVGIYEIMVLNNELRNHIGDATDMDKLREVAYREGVKPLRISGAMKVAAGMTTVDEVMKVAPPMQDRRSIPR